MENQTSGEGEWFEIFGAFPFTVHTSGLTGVGTVRILVSNAPEPSSGVQIGPDIHEDLTMVVKAPFRYIQAVISTPDIGAVNCWFYASQERS